MPRNEIFIRIRILKEGVVVSADAGLPAPSMFKKTWIFPDNMNKLKLKQFELKLSDRLGKMYSDKWYVLRDRELTEDKYRFAIYTTLSMKRR